MESIRCIAIFQVGEAFSSQLIKIRLHVMSLFQTFHNRGQVSSWKNSCQDFFLLSWAIYIYIQKLMTTFYRRSSNITESSENATSLRIHKTSGRGFWVREKHAPGIPVLSGGDPYPDWLWHYPAWIVNSLGKLRHAFTYTRLYRCTHCLAAGSNKQARTTRKPKKFGQNIQGSRFGRSYYLILWILPKAKTYWWT